MMVDRSNPAQVPRLGAGPWFAGEDFSMVDAVFAPVFRYFDVFEAQGEASLFGAAPKVRAWREALARRPSARQAVSPQYGELLLQFLLKRSSELSRRIAARLPQLTDSPESVK